MRLITDQAGDDLENIHFDVLTKIFADFENDFMEAIRPFQSLPVKEFGKKVMAQADFLIGTPIQKSLILDINTYDNLIIDVLVKASGQSLISRLFQAFVKNMTSIQSNMVEYLDRTNGQIISNTPEMINTLQRNALMKRRWRIVSNRLTRTIKRRLKGLVDQAVQTDQSTENLSRSIEDLFKKYNKGKAYNTRTIARTEMGSLIRNTEWDYVKQLEKTAKIKLQKHWYTKNDELVRIHHYGYYYDGWIMLAEYFTYEDRKMRYPHDPKGSADDVINCRCRAKYREFKAKGRRGGTPPKGSLDRLNRASIGVDRTTEEYARLIPAKERRIRDQKWIKSLTKDDRQLIKDYTNMDFETINPMLRNPRRFLQEFGRKTYNSMRQKANRLRTLINRTRLAEDTVVYRSFGTKLAKRSDIGVGTVFRDDAFSSTTLRFGTYENAQNVVAEILVKKGTRAAYVADYSQFLTERELLLNAGQEYRILGRRVATHHGREITFIQMEAL